jgi:phosphoribosylformylglycinamidine synthase
VESGLIPLDRGLKMSLARNAIGAEAVGFINEWVWITPTCKRDRCATSDWSGAMHLPIAHGEGRFTTRDKDIWAALRKADQVAFSYCDASGRVSEDPVVTPNGSVFAIAGLCNPRGNVVALMPHPERTPNGRPYFESMRRWIEGKRLQKLKRLERPERLEAGTWAVPERVPRPVEIFVGTIITNNEERTVEQAAHRLVPGLRLVQLKYLSPGSGEPEEILTSLSLFNPNKETAIVRRGGEFFRWDHDGRECSPLGHSPLEGSVALLRRDEPDTGASALGGRSETGICYICRGVAEEDLMREEVLEIFANPHASTLERMT